MTRRFEGRSTAHGNPSEQMPLPSRMYERFRDWSTTTLTGSVGSPLMERAPKAATPGDRRR